MKVTPFGLSTEEIRGELAPLRNDFSIAVCRAKNPFNIGAIIRVAHSFLVKEIFLIGSEPYYERASMGMQKYETIVDCPDEASFLAAIAGRPLAEETALTLGGTGSSSDLAALRQLRAARLLRRVRHRDRPALIIGHDRLRELVL